MAEDLKDVRAKLDPQVHADLSALATAKRTTPGDLLREAVLMYLADEERKAHEYKVFLRIKNGQGSSGEVPGIAPGELNKSSNVR
jgi:hypothetical protein